MTNIKKIAILQPEVPHYRTEFFDKLSAEFETTDIYVFKSLETTRKSGIKSGENITNGRLKSIWNKTFKQFLFYNPFVLLSGQRDALVLMLHFGHLTTWLLLLTRFLHRKKIILWGQVFQ